MAWTRCNQGRPNNPAKKIRFDTSSSRNVDDMVFFLIILSFFPIRKLITSGVDDDVVDRDVRLASFCV